MPTSRLTEAAIRRLPTPDKRKDIRDAVSIGLYLRIHPTGRKTWRMRYHFRDKPHILHLGEWPGLTLAEARQTVLSHRQILASGSDPAAAEQKAQSTRRQMPTVADFASEYIKRHARPNKRSWQEDQRILDRDVLPHIGRLRLDEVSRRDIVGLIDRIRDRGADVMANRTYAAIRKMFAFGVERGVLETTPAQHVRLTRETARDVVLGDDAIRNLWATTAPYVAESTTVDMEPTTRLALRLLLVTGQRSGEICGFRLSEMDTERRLWLLPSERTKNQQSHIVPLSDLALSVIEQAMSTTADDTFLLSSHGKTGHLTTSAPAHAMERIFATWNPKYTTHDLRRTVTTGIAALGFTRFLSNKITNHVDRTVGGIYDRYEYLDEKRAALDAWADRLNEVLMSKARANVIRLPARP